MGDRYERGWRSRPRHPGLERLPPPPELMAWGLSEPARIGHNQGPPLEDPPTDPFIRHLWRKAHAEAWRNPPLDILRLRVAWAEKAGVSYETYAAELLHTGRHLQAADVAKRHRRR
jgi:hypothetical protein